MNWPWMPALNMQVDHNRVALMLSVIGVFRKEKRWIIKIEQHATYKKILAQQ